MLSPGGTVYTDSQTENEPVGRPDTYIEPIEPPALIEPAALLEPIRIEQEVAGSRFTSSPWWWDW